MYRERGGGVAASANRGRMRDGNQEVGMGRKPGCQEESDTEHPQSKQEHNNNRMFNFFFPFQQADVLFAQSL